MINSNFEKLLDSCLRARKIPFWRSEEQAWEILQQRIVTSGKVLPLLARKSGAKTLVRLAVAASVVGLLIFAGIKYFAAPEETLITTEAGHNRVQLPDGSVVDINASSNLHFSAETWKDQRLVELEGEAFFNVQKGSSFTVVTPNGNVTVKGTSFNVLSRQQEFFVSCLSGAVEVTCNKNQVLLSPGKSASLKDTGLVVEEGYAGTAILWVKGVYSFNEAPLEKVLSVIEQQYGYQLIRSNLNLALLYTGEFTDNDLEQTLELVCKPLGLQYTINKEEKVITVKK